MNILKEIKDNLCTVGFVFGDLDDEGVEIKGVPVFYYFYKDYKDKKTIKNTLSKAKYYSAKIIHAN